MKIERRPFLIKCSTYVLAASAACLIWLCSAPQARAQQWTSDGSGHVTTTGSVGVGTTNPQSNLQVGTQTSSPTAAPDTVSLGGTFSSAAGANLKLKLYDDGITANTYGVGVSSGSMDFGVSSTAGYNWYIGGSNKVTFANSGSVGIGSTNPSIQHGTANRLLEIQGSVNPGLALTATSAGGRQYYLYSSQTNPGYFSVFDATAGADRLVVDGVGNVSVGASSPALQSGVTNRILEVQGTLNPGLALTATSAGGRQYFLYSSQANPGYFSVFDASAGADRLTIGSTGNVGIGKSNASVALDVVGDINATGNISAKYQDVAEWVPSTQKLTAGTVVVLDPERANNVLASTASYDTAVAGVVSERPGISLGEGGEGKVLVATTGRVRVKVDATRAPIKVGDLLVTSDREGVAMKSEPVEVGGRKMHAPGTIIGKALEPLAGGTGEILVLLSLQ
jgi:hypothetical protein